MDLLPVHKPYGALLTTPARFPPIRLKGKQITSVVDWLQAFTVYTAAITSSLDVMASRDVGTLARGEADGEGVEEQQQRPRR